MGKTRMYEPYGYNEGEAYYSIRNTIDDEIKINRKIDKKQTDESFTDVSYDSDLETVLFKNTNGDIVGQLPMTDIMASSLVKEAKYDADTQKIIIEFDNGDVVSVDLNDIINIQEAGDGLVLDDNKFAILLDPDSEEFLQVSENGIKNVGIQDAIDAERDRAISAETKETNERIADVDEEETRAKGEESVLRQLITLEENRAKGEEQRIDDTLGTAFTTSSTETVTAKYDYLNQKIEDETTARQDADVALKAELIAYVDGHGGGGGGGGDATNAITGVTFNGSAATVRNNVAAITATIPSSLSDLSNTAHTHTTGDVTNLQAVLNNYATTQDIQDFITEDSLSGYATTQDIQGFVTEDALNGYATKQDIEGFITEESLSGYVKTQDLDGFVTTQDLDEYAKETELEDYAKQDWVEEKGYLVSQDLSGYALTSDVEETYQPKGNYITPQSIVNYNYATETYVSDEIAKVVGAAPETLDTLEEIAAVLSGTATMQQVADAISTKANSADVYTRWEIDAKIGDLGTVIDEEATDETPEVSHERSVKEYVDDSIKTVNEKPEVETIKLKYNALISILGVSDTQVNNTVVSQELENSNNVNFTDGVVNDIEVPNKTATITVDLDPNSTLTLTSPKSVTLNNASDEATNLTVDAPSSGSTPTVTIKDGNFDTITVKDASLTVQNDATLKKVVITQDTTKSLTINAIFEDGATITSNSNAPITVNNKNAEGEDISITIDASGSTVTFTGGKWETVNATVSTDTLIINKNVHIENLNVAQGNVIVKVPRQSDIESVVKNYEAASGYTIDYLKDNVSDSNQSILNTTGEHTLTEDITHKFNFSVGTFSTDDIVWELNNHSLTVNNTRGIAGFKLRASAKLEINGPGSFIVPEDYGIWSTASNGDFTAVVVNGGNICGATHVLYAEKGVIEVNGGTFRLSNPDACDTDANGNFKFLLNCLDANYRNGTANIIVRGGTFYDFDPGNCAAEGPGTSFLAAGYHTVETTVTEDGKQHKIYTVVPD